MKKILISLLCASIYVCNVSANEAKPSAVESQEIEKKCVSGDFEACNQLEQLFSVDKLKLLCESGNMLKCGLLGIKYKDGNGVDQDLIKARKLLKQSCENEFAHACYKLAFMYSKGQGVRLSHSIAAEYFGEACDLGHKDACLAYHLADQLARQQMR